MPVQNCPIYDPKRHRCVDVPLLPARSSFAKKPPRVLAFSQGQVYTKLDAYNFAFLSLLAYQDSNEVKQFFDSLNSGSRPVLRPEPEDIQTQESYLPVLCLPEKGGNFVKPQSISTSLMGTQAFFAIRETELVIACRGTEPAPSRKHFHEVPFTDISTDTDALQVTAPAYLSGDGRALLHRGFLASFEEMREGLEGFLHQNKSINFDSVKVCGHSLGGALAALCAVYLARKGVRRVLLYTFGQPRVGNLHFCREVDRLSNLVAFRLDHLGDPVPHVPPPWSGPLLDLMDAQPIHLALLPIRPSRILLRDLEAFRALTTKALDPDKGVYGHFGIHVPLARSDRGIPGVVVNGAQEITLTTLYLTPEEEGARTGAVPNQVSHHSMFEYLGIVQGDLLRFLGFLYESRDLRAGATYEFQQRQVQLVELRKELERRRELWRPNARGILPTEILSRTIQEIEWLEYAFQRCWDDGNGKSSDRIWQSIHGEYSGTKTFQDELRLQWEQRVFSAQDRVQEFVGQKTDLPNVEKVKTLMHDTKAREAEIPDLARKPELPQW